MRMLPTINPIALAVALLATSAALADEGRKPVAPAQSRATEVSYDRYHRTVELVRTRTDGKALVTFHAEPQLLEAGAIAVLEVRSVAKTGSVTRWRCIAVRDIAECLGVPVALRYLPEDHRMVMSVTMKPQTASAQQAMALAIAQ